jgi:hypothetical protein
MEKLSGQAHKNAPKESIKPFEKARKRISFSKKQSLRNISSKKNLQEMSGERSIVSFSIPIILAKHGRRKLFLKELRKKFEEELKKEENEVHSFPVEQWNALSSEINKKRNYFELRSDIILTKSDFLAYMDVIKKIKQAYKQIEPSNSNKVEKVLEKIKALEKYWKKSFLHKKRLDITQIKDIFAEQRKVNEEKKALLKKAKEIIKPGDFSEENSTSTIDSLDLIDLKKEKEEKAFYKGMITSLNEIEKDTHARGIAITLMETLEKDLDEFHQLSLEEQSTQHDAFWRERNRKIDIAELKMNIAWARINFSDEIEDVKSIKNNYALLGPSHSNHVKNVLVKIKELEDCENQFRWYECNSDKIPKEEVSDTIKKVKQESSTISEKARELIKLVELKEEINPPNLTCLSEDRQIEAIIKKIVEKKKEEKDKALKNTGEKQLGAASFSYSIKDLPAIYRKLQRVSPLLLKFEKLLHLRSDQGVPYSQLKYIKLIQKTNNLSDKMIKIEKKAVACLQGLEKSWGSLTRQEKQQINTARDLLIKNKSRRLNLEKEFVANREKNPNITPEYLADRRRKLEEQYPSVKDLNAIKKSEQEDVIKILGNVSGKWLMRKEQIEKEEELTHQWLLSVKKRDDGNYSELDTVNAIDDLERFHIFSEWVSFDKLSYEYLLSTKKSDEYRKIIVVCELMQDKIRNLINRISIIFGSEIEAVREMIDKGEIALTSRTVDKNIKYLESLLEEVEQGCLKQKTLDDLLNIQEIFNLNLKRCHLLLSNVSLPFSEREQCQQILTLNKAIEKCLEAEIRERHK